MRLNKFQKIFFGYLLVNSIILFFLFSENRAQAQQKQKEEQKNTVAPVPVQKIEKYKQDNDFKYIKQPPVVDFWGIVWGWVSDFLSLAFSDKGVAPYIRYAVIGLVIAFALIKILGGDFSGVFVPGLKSGNQNGFKYADDNIHKIDFEKEIKTAIKNQNFRLATRFLYLKLLKVLNEIEYIRWQADKTNSSYQHELKNTNISNSFKNLSKMYEYSWYGHFDLNHAEFEQLSKEYESTFLSLKAKA